MKIGQFIKSWLSDGSDVSSKRINGLIAMLLIVACVIVHLATKQVIQGEILYILAGIVTAMAGAVALIDPTNNEYIQLISDVEKIIANKKAKADEVLNYQSQIESLKKIFEKGEKIRTRYKCMD